MKTSYHLILIILLISCKPENKGLIKFDPTTLTENEISLIEITDDIYYIPLDNTYPIGLIYDKIKLINSSIYLSAQNTGVLEFKRDGKLLRKIGSFGRGPSEYIYKYPEKKKKLEKLANSLKETDNPVLMIVRLEK